MGLSFETAAKALKRLYEKEPEFANPASERRFMLWWDKQERSLQLVEFDLEKAIASVKAGEPVIPVWLDKIDQRLTSKLEALRFLGKPFEVLTQIKKRIFAA